MFYSIFLFQPVLYTILVRVFGYDDLAIWITCITSEICSMSTCFIFSWFYVNIEKAASEAYLNHYKQIENYKHEYHLVPPSETENPEIKKIG